MKRVLGAALGAIILLIGIVPQALGAARGVRDGVAPSAATPAVAGNTNFDNIVVPADFVQTVVLHKLDGVSFTGGGTVLNSSGGFLVTGFSAPNFLAFNCGAKTADPATAKLPETIKLPGTVAVHLSVGSAGSAGKILKLQGSGSKGSETHLVTLAPALQVVTFTKHVQTIKLSSADKNNPVCILVVDDIVY